MGDAKARETSALWGWLRDGTRHLRPALVLNRIENLCDRGTPDVEGHLGGQIWCELKTCARAPRLRVKVSDEQVRWHRRRAEAGGRSFFLVQVGSGRGAARYLLPGRHGHELLTPDLTEPRLARLSALPPSCSPEDVARMLGKKAP